VQNLKKILIVWSLIAGGYLLSLLIFDHRPIYPADALNRIIQSLLFILAIFIVLNEQQLKNRVIFINFTAFFFVSGIVQMLQSFMGVLIFPDKQYAFILFWQYCLIAYIFFLSIAIIYLVIDLLFRNFKIYQKYLVALAIVFSFFVYYYHPFFEDPLYLYNVEEIKQWKTLQSVIENTEQIPTPAELASQVTLQAWAHGQPIGDLFPEVNLRQMEYLAPYLEGDNWMVLLTKPLYLGHISMNVLLLGFILLFFGYQYKKDPPQGAYIDKMMFIFLIYCSMEILHFWGSLKSVEWKSYIEVSIIGQYITVFLELLLGAFFALRLAFITSVQGEFYEAELARNPAQISRWRDWVDNLVLSHFFNSNPFIGRFFQSPSESNGLAPKMTAHPSNRGIYGKRH
jgi:hypothetical protein